MDKAVRNGFAQALKHWRRQSGLSQTALAVDANVSVRHLSFIECGRSQPSPALALRLVDALPLTPLRRKEILALAGIDLKLDDSCDSDNPEPNARATAQRLLDRCHPYPAFLMDRYMNVVQSNAAFDGFFNGTAFPVARFNDHINIPLTLANTEGLSSCLDNWEGLFLDLLWRIEHSVNLHPGDRQLRELSRTLNGHSLTQTLLKHGSPGAQSDAELSRLRVSIGDINISLIRTSSSFWGVENGEPKLYEIQSVLPADEQSAQIADPVMTMLNDEFRTDGVPADAVQTREA